VESLAKVSQPADKQFHMPPTKDLLREPPIAFSTWTRWQDRSRLRHPDAQPHMGVYLWARFRTPPDASSVPYPDLCEEVIYVGETNDLNVRPLGSTRHHRVANYLELFPDDPTLARLYVAVCTIAPFQPQDAACHAWRAFTRHLEARIAWEYTKLVGRRPLLDYKRGKDEFALPAAFRNLRTEPHR
jgi:hypothetical protein